MLYICATPIGNLSDISFRAVEILAASNIILCEDTRVSKLLLNHHNINYKRLVALHEHNENEVATKVIQWLEEKLTITLISDAGTPGISDPGARLCDKVLATGIKLSPIPGACSYTSLLSVSGISTPCLFYGFLPSKSGERCKTLAEWGIASYTVCIYEAPHRIIATMKDIVNTLGANRQIIMGRELTKQFETIKKATSSELFEFIAADVNQQRGEFTLIIYPNTEIKQNSEELTREQTNALTLLINELPPKKAVSLTHKLFGGNKDLLYDYTLKLKQNFLQS